MKRIHRLFLSVLSGVLLSLPWLGFPGWIVFVAFVPLLVLDIFFDKYKQGFPGISFWGHVFLATLIWNTTAAWWMAQATVAGVFSAMIFNAFLMAMVWWLAHLIRRNFSSGLGYIALVAIWLAYEYLQFNWDLEWPCLQLGSILAKHLNSIQWYEYTGTFGGTLWVLLLNILLFRIALYIHQKKPVRQIIIALLAYATFLFVPLSISLLMYYSYEEKENPRQIAIVQPNVDPYLESFDTVAEEEKLNNFIRLAKQVCNNETDFLVGPETVFENPDDWNEDALGESGFLMQLDSFIQEYKKVEMVLGVSSYKTYANKAAATVTARKADGIFFDLFNTALFLNRQGETQLYHKSKLVMGVEKTPFIKNFPALKHVFIDLGGASGTLGQDKEATNFVAADGIQIAPIICFESVFGEYVASFVKKGAELIFVITNDGWWKNSRGYKQHLLFSQLRAIETRRSIVRAANTGTSCFINQRGDVQQATDWWQEASLKGTINANNKITFYVEYGDSLARVAAFVSVLLLLLLLAKKLKYSGWSTS